MHVRSLIKFMSACAGIPKGAYAVVEGMVVSGPTMRLLRLDLQVWDTEERWERFNEVSGVLREEGHHHNPYDPRPCTLREHQFGRLLVEVIT